jgi:hypothetical protein
MRGGARCRLLPRARLPFGALISARQNRARVIQWEVMSAPAMYVTTSTIVNAGLNTLAKPLDKTTPCLCLRTRRCRLAAPPDQSLVKLWLGGKGWGPPLPAKVDVAFGQMRRSVYRASDVWADTDTPALVQRTAYARTWAHTRIRDSPRMHCTTRPALWSHSRITIPGRRTVMAGRFGAPRTFLTQLRTLWSGLHDKTQTQGQHHYGQICSRPAWSNVPPSTITPLSFMCLIQPRAP